LRNCVSSCGIEQLVPRNSFLSGQLLADQFARYPQGSAGRMRKCLSATEFGV
jgi:hypothetical protein